MSFSISAIIGLAAGLLSADDTGRPYWIGVAAAVRYAVFPVWFGIVLVLGFPDRTTIEQRLLTLGINLVTIAYYHSGWSARCYQTKTRAPPLP